MITGHLSKPLTLNDKKDKRYLEQRIKDLETLVVSESHLSLSPKVYSNDFVIDDNCSKIMLVKYSTSSTIANIFMKGALFPVAFYTELGIHSHSTTVVSLTHRHAFSDNYALGNHDHGGVTGADSQFILGTPKHDHTITADGADTIAIAGNTGNPNANSTIASTTAGVNGGAISAAVKTYADSVQLWINGVNVTADILALTGWVKIGDGTNTHAFVTTGTGEIDLNKYMTVGINTLEIKEPTAAKGGRVLMHVEIS